MDAAVLARRAARRASAETTTLPNDSTWVNSSDKARPKSSTFLSKVHQEHLYSRGTDVRNSSVMGDWTTIECQDALDWVNDVLKRAKGTTVKDVGKLGDGVTLPRLVQVLTSKPVAGVHPRPAMKIHIVENVRKCLRSIEQNKVVLDGITAEDVVGGNLKAILALCHCLRLRYKAPDSSFQIKSPPPRSLSPTREAWVSEDRVETTDEKAKRVENRLSSLLNSPELTSGISPEDEREENEENEGDHLVLPPPPPLPESAPPTDLPSSVAPDDDVYVPSDPLSDAQRPVYRSSEAVMTAWNKDLGATLASSLDKRFSSPPRDSFLTPRGRSLSPPRRDDDDDDDEVPLSQLVPPMRKTATRSLPPEPEKQTAFTSNNPLKEMGKMPKKKTRSQGGKKNTGKFLPLHAKQEERKAKTDAIDVDEEETPSIKRSGDVVTIAKKDRASKCSIASVPEILPAMLQMTQSALASRPENPVPNRLEFEEDEVIIDEESSSPPPPSVLSPANVKDATERFLRPEPVSITKMSASQLVAQIAIADPNSSLTVLLENLVSEIHDLRKRQDDLARQFESERQLLRSQIHRQAKTIKRLTIRDSKGTGHRRQLRSVTKHFSTIESDVVKVARSAAQLAAQLERQETLQQDVDALKETAALGEPRSSDIYLSPTGKKSSGLLAFSDEIESKRSNRLSPSDLHSPQQIQKLKRFFGEEPPLLKHFLKKLGYVKLIGKFEKEKVTMLELPYLDEERLIQMGIPMGPTARILAELEQMKAK